MRRPRLARLALYVALGPVTGPLLAGALRHRRADPLLSALYTWSAVLWLAEGARVLAALLTYIGGHAR